MSRHGTRQSSLIARRGGAAQRVKFFAKKIGLSLLGLVILAASVWGIYASGFFAKQAEAFDEWFVEKTAEHGFVVKNLMIEGRTHLSKAGLKTLLNVEENAPLFAQDLEALHAKLMQLSWVKSAVVERHWPDTLYIRITEREPIALWQRAGKLTVVDDEGVALTHLNIENFKKLLVVVGEDAPQNTRKLLAILDTMPNLKSRVDAAKRVGQRRWDLTLNNKMIVKLPEDNPEAALERLAALEASENIFEKPITVIDVRQTGRVIVQTKSGDAQSIDQPPNKAEEELQKTKMEKTI